MIRAATARDLPALVRMAGDFIAATATGLPFDADYLDSSFRAMIAAPDRLVLVLDINGACGVLCAAAARSPWAPVAIASEMGFWIDPPHRGRWGLRLLHAYLDWARGMGCGRAGMVAFANNPLDRLYQKAGFRLSELTYDRVI